MTKKNVKKEVQNKQEKIYLDNILPIQKRVENLLSLMTLEEKIAQLGSAWVYEILDGHQFSDKKAVDLLKDGIGQITRLGGASNLSPDELVRIANRIQRYLIQNTRLGIPAIIHEESCSGYMAKGATCFPQMIGMASTWDPELLHEMGKVIKEQMKAVGVHQALAPVLDVTRDARWGRVEETFGEDPYLVSAMGSHYIRGIQGISREKGVMATAKHFVGYGVSEGGMNWAPPHIPPREMREVFLLPFEVAVKEAGIAALMPGYQELDGIPCHASRDFLRELLREEWGFDGLVVSDYFAINMLKETHLVASDKEDAAKQAIEAGVDIELPSTDCYGKPLKDLFVKGVLTESMIDAVVGRILKMKFLLGIFDHPYADEKKASKIFDTPEQRRLAHIMAQKSIVLLKNAHHTLPVSRDIASIAVIGPNADRARNILGDYAYPCHIESLLDMKKDNQAFHTPVPEKIEMVEQFLPVLSILEGLEEKAGKDTKIFYAQGCEVRGDSRNGFAEAVQIARNSDIAIVIVGDKSGLIDDCTSGETRDRADLDLPGVQEELIREIYQTGTPVIVVLINGRPLSIGWLAQHVPAIIEAWLPGEEGARAIADILFGDCNPGGRLPMSFPRSVGQVPVYYNHKPSGGRSHWKGDYVEMSSKPLYPFGYGISYTHFSYHHMDIQPDVISWDGQVEISVEVQNAGSCTGDEVAQLYIHDEVAQVTRPVKELKGFKRITLKAGEKKKITFILSGKQLGFYDQQMKFIVEPGMFKVMIGSSSQDIRLTGTFQITGEMKEIGKRKEYFTTIRVES